MRRYFQKNRLFTLCLLAVFFTLTAMVSCTEVDDTLGEGLIPGDQNMKVDIAYIKGLDAYLAKVDTFPTTNTATGLVGSLSSQEFGRTSSSFACQFISYEFTNDDGFGFAPVADSLALAMYFYGVPEGDTSKRQTINVYPLKERIWRDSSYYSFTDLEALADMSEPLFSFDYKGYISQMTITIPVTPKVQDFMNSIMDTVGGIYGNSDLWYKRFPGWYFVPAETSPKDASIIPFMLDKMQMSLFMHNYTDASATQLKDSIFTLEMLFNDDVDHPNGSVNAFRHDYANSQVDAARINDTLSTSVPVDIAYAQGMSGVVTYLRFRDSFITELKSKLVEPYRTLVVNQAKLEIGVQDPTIERLNSSMDRVGLYSNYRTFTGIVDYAYDLEESSPIAYGGYLNRTYSNYQMDITTFVQGLMTNMYPVKTMTLGPSFYELTRATGSVLNTSNQPDNPTPMTVKVTYTLVR